MNIVKELYKLRKGVTYRDSDHTYWRGDKRLISTTQLKERYKQPFDTEYWSTYKVIQAQEEVKKIKHHKEGYYVNDKFISFSEAQEIYREEAEELKKEWTKIAEKAKVKGTAIHVLFEMAWMGEITENETINQFCQERLDREWIPVGVEMMVANDWVAGRFDGLFYYKDKYFIRDIKTDKIIKYGNPYQYMKEPFNDLEDCNYSGYTVQLNLYRDIIEKGSEIKIEGMMIDHYKDTGENVSIEVIQIPKYEIPWERLEQK